MKYVTDAASKFLKTQSTAPISTKTENKGAQELLFKVINEEISGDITALLKQGANPYIKDEKGHTAFDYAIKANNLKAAHIMYQSGSNEEYKELLAGYTITQLETSKNDFAAFNQVVAYSEKSNIPEIRAHAEELMYNQSIRLYIISDNQLDKYLEDNPNILLYDNVNKSVPSTVDNLHKNGYLNIIPDNKIEAELNNFLIENKINIDNIANKFLQEQKIYKNLPKDISGYTEEEKSAFINDHKREIFFHHNNAITEEDLRKISPNIKLKEFLIKHKINMLIIFQLSLQITVLI